MKFLLDSNIVIAACLGEGRLLRERMAACDEGDFVTSAIVYAELRYGSARGKPPVFEQLATFTEEVAVLVFDMHAAMTYASMPFRRGGYDRLIAAHALSLDLILVTDNVEHFADIADLRVENWLR